MARQETIKILRSEVPSATPSLTAGEIAVNIADRRLFVGGTGGTSDRVTFRDERSTVWSVNSLTGSVTLGVGQLSDVNFEDPPEQYQFLQWNGVDEWKPAYAVTFLNTLFGSVTLTGDGGSLLGRNNNIFTNRTATTGVTGVASFLPDHFTVSGTGHVSSKGVITINNTAPDANGNFNVAAATVVTGDGGSLVGDGVAIRARLATASLTGVASFNSTYFSVASTGHVTLASAYQATGDTVITTAGSGIAISTSGKTDTLFNIGVTGFNGLTGNITVTGDGGSLVGLDNNKFTNRLATASLTGVASFNSNRFSVSNGAVDLATAYQATGDTVQAGSGIVIGSGKTITNIGVTGFNGLTGNITVTGDSGSLVGRENNKFTNRLATTGVTGVASFSSTYFSVSNGAVSLASAYQATGDTVVGSSNIGVSRNGNTVIVTNAGIREFNGATGTITLTGDGGSVSVLNNVGVGDAYNYNIANRLASTSLTGVASFSVNDFTVSGTGQVSVSTTNAIPVQFRDSSGIIAQPKWGSTVTLTGGSGVEVDRNASNTFSFRGITATNSTLGVASFNATRFSVSSGAVDLAAAYQATGDTVITVAGSGIAISTSGRTDTIYNIGVTGFNGLTGNITVTGDGGSLVGRDNNKFTNRLADTSVTGVASFNATRFSVSNGAVDLAAAYQATGDTIVAGSNITIVRSNNQVTINGNEGLASSTLTGVASFNSTYFSVASTGHVTLASAYQATGDTVQAGSGIVIGSGKTITNIGVTGIGFGSDVGLTGKVNITAGSNITITQSGNLITVSGVAQQVTAVTGDGASIVGRDNSNITARVATTGVTGVASFSSTYFSVSNGAVDLAAAYQATGDTIITVAGSGIALATSGRTDTIYNIGVTGFNGLTGNITVTGDGGSLVGLDNNKFTNRLATTGVTGVASFNSTRFSVSNGAVDLAAAYQATGDTVQAGSGIVIGSGKTITNIGVTGFNGLTGSITVTGDGGSLIGRDNNKFTNRLADTSVTGVASFNSTYFSVSNGAVSLASAYQATGDTIITVAGSGIALATSGRTDTIYNIGVTGFNGLTGNITVTGDGGSLVGLDNNKFTNRLATTGVTGVASFNSTRFSVSNGAVDLATAYQATGDTIVAGSNITIVRSGNSVTVNANEGLASSTLTGVASFNSTYFSVASTGHVTLASAYQSTGDTVITVAGSGIAISTSGKTDTLFNIGVTGFNGLTGDITVTGDGGSLVGRDNNKFTNRITQLYDNTANPTTGLTGVSMFNCRDFTVDANGLVSIAAFSQCNAGGGGGCACSAYTTQETCEANGCGWTVDFGGGSCYCPSPFNSAYNGLGASADANGGLAFLYLDIGSLSAAPSGTTILSTDSILFYDASETALVKTKRATISKLILDNDNLFSSKSSSQFTTTRGSSSIEFGVVLGNISSTDQGLIKGASAFSYIAQNTVKSMNGLTGDVTVVGSVNGCSGNAITITGTVNEVNVATSCPTITIGLPDNIVVPYISGTGATFSGTVNANLFIGTVSGGTF